MIRNQTEKTNEVQVYIRKLMARFSNLQEHGKTVKVFSLQPPVMAASTWDIEQTHINKYQDTTIELIRNSYQ